MALLASAAVPGAGLAAERTAAQEPSATVALTGPAVLSPKAPKDELSHGLTLAIGDLLAITVFEQHGWETGRLPSAHAALSNLIERPELTGQYSIHTDGMLFLPFVGGFVAAGRTQADLLQAIEEELSRVTGGRVKVGLRMVERQPVYVTGHVPRAGVFKYTPGMTVLHALAMAGASESNAADYWRTLDLTRELERLQKAEDRLKRLLARATVLDAEGREAGAAVPSPRLVALAGERRAHELVADAASLRQLELDRSRLDDRGLTSVLHALASERKILQESLKFTQQTVKDLARRVEEVDLLRVRKMTTDSVVHTTHTELSTARQRWNELRAAASHIERSFAEVQQQQKKVQIEMQIERDRLIQETRTAIAEEEVTMATLGRFLRGQSSIQKAAAGRESELKFKILRQMPAGLKELDATELSQLHPGDVLKASLAKPVGE